jgi:type I restriction-modification system DNA methylase subunit
MTEELVQKVAYRNQLTEWYNLLNGDGENVLLLAAACPHHVDIRKTVLKRNIRESGIECPKPFYDAIQAAIRTQANELTKLAYLTEIARLNREIDEEKTRIRTILNEIEAQEKR